MQSASSCSATENFQYRHSAQSASLCCSRCKPSRIGLLPGTTQAVLRGIQLLFCWTKLSANFSQPVELHPHVLIPHAAAHPLLSIRVHELLQRSILPYKR